MTLGGRTFPGIADEGFQQGPRANAGREGTPVLTVVNPDDPMPVTGPVLPVAGESLIDEIVRYGARRMLAAALEAEVAHTSLRPPARSTTTAVAWSCGMVAPSRGRY
jgi:hypothetical protein